MSEKEFIAQLLNNKQSTVTHFPDKPATEYFIEKLFHFLFANFSAVLMAADTWDKYQQLKNTFASLLSEIIKEEEQVKNHTEVFFHQLPVVYQTLLQDAEAILQSDPAATSISEVMVAYPGFFATAIYRISNQLWKQAITILPRLFCEYAHSKTGIDIHPAASIGKSFAIDHGTGIVIGETTLIGNNVKLYQGVTLGALNVDKNSAKNKRHPTIEDNVVIYSGATILGGKTIIGEGSIIGGNVWLTYSIPPNSVVYHKSEIRIKDKDPFLEPLNFII